MSGYARDFSRVMIMYFAINVPIVEAVDVLLVAVLVVAAAPVVR